jgi:hypothetical protein
MFLIAAAASVSLIAIALVFEPEEKGANAVGGVEQITLVTSYRLSPPRWALI